MDDSGNYAPDPKLSALFEERGKDPSKYEGYNLFETMGKNGDTKSIWDKNNPDEVEAARQQFNYLVKQKKYVAFHVEGDKGEKGSQMKEFDPKAERVIFVPPMAGG